ncbi:MAG: response regulator transcription factor [Saprospiraceae bacterium]
MKVQEIKKVWYNINHHIAKDSISHDVENVNNTIASLLCPGPYYYYIFDFSIMQFVLLSATYTDIIGVSTEALTITDYLERVHPDDLAFFKKCEEIASHFLFEFLEPAEIPHYKVSYPVRFQTADETYKLFLHQAIGISFDEEGKMSRVYAVDSDISHIATNNRKRLSLIGINGRPSYTNIDVFKDDATDYERKISKLSTREVEILQLLSEGSKSKDIAIRFSISELTVKKHRENLLRKTKAKNVANLIAIAIREGLI